MKPTLEVISGGAAAEAAQHAPLDGVDTGGGLDRLVECHLETARLHARGRHLTALIQATPGAKARAELGLARARVLDRLSELTVEAWTLERKINPD